MGKMQTNVNQDVWYNKVGFIVLVEVFYLIVLFTIALFYFTNLRELLPAKLPYLTIPDSFGSIPVGVLWFGALGGVVISLSGTVDHRHNWDSSWKYWHITRPFVGVALSVISVMIFQAGILSVGSSIPATKSPTASQNLLYYLVSFVVGYREEAFRELIKRLTDIILSPGGEALRPVIESVVPTKGAENDQVIIKGRCFKEVSSVRFGSAFSPSFQIESDNQMTATIPPGSAGKTVNITITSKAGSSTGGKFTYTDQSSSDSSDIDSDQ
ncbi:MAG: hypothetical protein HGB15_06985 [Chlorobaculum sp.]|nr:hypothetical protein [Chlorobaculum sp.]